MIEDLNDGNLDSDSDADDLSFPSPSSDRESSDNETLYSESFLSAVSDTDIFDLTVKDVVNEFSSESEQFECEPSATSATMPSSEERVIDNVSMAHLQIIEKLDRLEQWFV